MRWQESKDDAISHKERRFGASEWCISNTSKQSKAPILEGSRRQVFLSFSWRGQEFYMANMHFPVEVLGFPPFFKNKVGVHHYLGIIQFFVPFQKWWQQLPGFFSVWTLSILQDDRDYLVSMGITTHEEMRNLERGEGNEKAVDRRFFGRFAECAP